MTRVGAAECAGERPAWLGALAQDMQRLDHRSTAERVAGLLRRSITEGEMPPRTHLSEEQLIAVLQVSRNTLREAFRLLTHEGLLTRWLHRGVYVRELTEADLVDLYRLRRIIECSIVRDLDDPGDDLLRPLLDDVKASQESIERGDWVSVGTANMSFHAHLVALAGSPRTNEVIETLLAQLRLAFHTAASPQRLHEPYAARNRALLDLITEGEYEQAAGQLEVYLQDSRAELVDAIRGQRIHANGSPGAAQMRTLHSR